MDLITYTNNIIQLRLDIAEISNSEADNLAKSICSDYDGKVKLLLTKIPTTKKDNASVSLVRNIDEEVIESIPSMEVIGWLEDGQYKFFPYGQDKYESVYSIEPKTHLDDEGVERTYTPPYMMGVFA